MAIQLKKWQWKSALTNTKSDFKRTFSFRKKHTHITKENGNNHSDVPMSNSFKCSSSSSDILNVMKKTASESFTKSLQLLDNI